MEATSPTNNNHFASAMYGAFERIVSEPQANIGGLVRGASDRMVSEPAACASSLDAGTSGRKTPPRQPSVQDLLQPGMVVTMLYFERPLDVCAVREVMRTRLQGLPLFCSRLKLTLGDGMPVTLQEIPEAEMVSAIKSVVTEQTGIRTEHDIGVLVSFLCKERLDALLPLWRAFVVNNLIDGRSLLLLATHPAISEGANLVQGLNAILSGPVEPARGLSGCLAQLAVLCSSICGGGKRSTTAPPRPQSETNAHDMVSLETAVFLGQRLNDISFQAAGTCGAGGNQQQTKRRGLNPTQKGQMHRGRHGVPPGKKEMRSLRRHRFSG